jgi:hypothetical protein
MNACKITSSILLLLLLCSHRDLFSQTSPAYKDTVFTEYFRRTSGWTASDATISVPLPEGKTIWLFGDSYIDNFNPGDTTIPCLFQVRNSMMVQNILHPTEFVTILDNTQTGVNRTPVKLKNNDDVYFWPAHGYAKRDTAIIFWQGYSGADYTHVSTYVSKIFTRNLTDASVIKKFAQVPLPPEFEFGTSVLADSASQYIYVYGFKKDWIIFRPLLARFPLDQDVFGPWEFYTGNGWSPDTNDVQQLMGSTDDYVSPSFSVIKLQGKYYMISQDIGFLTCGLGRDIYSWESDSPEGPFINKKLLYTIEDKYRGEYMITYNATAHPEFIKDNELLISYNVNGACTSYCNNPFTDRYNADLYRPKFIRVPLQYIDPALNVPDPVFPIDSPVTGLLPEENPSKEFSVYPNPSRDGEITIAMNDARPQHRLRIQVANVYGQYIANGYFDEAKNTIHIRNKGLYFVYISSGMDHYVTKVIIQ